MNVPQVCKNIAFMHIPKTAGVSVVDAFTNRLGHDECNSFSPTITDNDFLRKRFVSGHVYLGDITRNAFVFTFFRDPVQQLASHLLWIDHYNMPEHNKEANGFPPSVIEGIKALDGKDLSSARDLDRYLAELPIDSVLRVRNLQSELMSFCRGKVTPLCDKRLAELAIGNIPRLSFAGFSENLSDEMSSLFTILDLGDTPKIKRLNPALSRRSIDISASPIRRVLESYVQADMRLYEKVKRIKSQRSWLERLSLLSGNKWNLRTM